MAVAVCITEISTPNSTSEFDHVLTFALLRSATTCSADPSSFPARYASDRACAANAADRGASDRTYEAPRRQQPSPADGRPRGI